MATPRNRLLDDDPPPIRRRQTRPFALLAAALVLGALLIVVVMNIDEEVDERVSPDEVIELISPKPLTDTDRATGAPLGAAVQPELARGGWVRMTDPETGRLAQQYRCDRLDPDPEGLPQGWLRLEQPRMEIYLKDDRVVTLAGDSAVAYAPHRAIEMGTITGNVLLHLYENLRGRSVDPDRDTPALVVTTDEASFESFLGEIRCENRVRIETPRLLIPGEALSLLVDDQNDTIQLRIDRYDYIRLISPRDEEPIRAAMFTSSPAMVFASKDAPDRRGSAVAPSRRADTPMSSMRSANFVRGPRGLQDGGRSGSGGEAQFYLLTLRDNIRIDQGSPTERKQARGERLELVFSMESEGIDRTVAMASSLGLSAEDPPRHLPSSASFGPWPAMLASMVLVVSPPDDAEIESLLGRDVTLIRGDGPLTVVPLEDDSRRPPDASDAVLDLIGSPVMLCDVPGMAQAVGAAIRYESAIDTVTLRGSNTDPLRIDSPELQAGGEMFWLRNSDGRAGFDGTGWMVNRSRDLDRTAMLACAAPNVAGESARQQDRPGRIARPRPPDDAVPELQITWDEGMVIEFNEQADGERGGRIRAAHFTGRVRVQGEEFTLDAHEMRVGFPEDGRDETQIESIHAIGHVRVLGVGQTNAILCDELDLELTQSSMDRTIPQLMVATGDVQAIDDEQMIWSDRLRIRFREALPSAVPGESPEANGDAAHDRRRDVQVEELLAEDDVQVLLADGSRAFADRLVGDGIRETVVLTGENVTIVSEGMIVDQGTRLEIDRTAARTPGPGQLRIFTEPLLLPERSRVARPAPDEAVNPMLVYATWRDSMHFDSTFNDGAGSIDFRGNVDVASRPSPVEQSTMRGEVLTLEFMFAEPDGRDPGKITDERGSPMDIRRGSRELAKLIARGDAKIESHEWRTPEHGGASRIFYVAGNVVEFDNRTGAALAVGDVELLMHDPWPEAEGQAADVAPFGSKGSTMLRCTKQVRLTPRVASIDDVLASGEVELRHRDLDGTVSWLTCEELEASILRPRTGHDEADVVNRTASKLDLGGSGTLERVRAIGGAVVNSGQRTVQCQSFDYDVPSAIARVSGAPGRLVTVETRGAPGVTRADEIVWFLDRDVIQISRPAGSGPR